MANLFTRFLGRTASEGAAFAFGLAAAPVLSPPVEELKNEAWRTYPTRALEPGDAAEIVAEDVELRGWGADEAAAHGVNGERFDALVGAVLNAPGFADLLTLKRRGLISDQQFEHGLRKGRLETLWDSGLTGLEDVLLTVADLANAVVQGHMDQGAAAAEALKQGVSADRFNVLVENTGLPPGPATLLEWRRRGFITDAELDQGIREGHTKTKYIPFFHDALAAQLSTAQIVGLRVKGWITPEESYTLGAGHGFTPAQMDQMWEEAGRPATVHQIHIGYARGAKVEGAASEEDAIRQSVQRSDIQTRYGDVLFAQRYTYPSAFVLRGLVTSGAISEADAEQILIFSGWEPTLSKKVAQFWSGSQAGTPTVDPYVEKAQTHLWTTLQREYTKGDGVLADTQTALATLIPDAATRDAVFKVWDVERAYVTGGS